MPIQKLSPNFEAAVGVEANAYQYNGIERVEDFGLEVSHAQFRTLDAQTGRWWQIDPMAEFAPAWTPYRFAFDNPIAYIDPLGLFETKKEARRYRREHDTGGKIVKSRENGKKTFSIETETQYVRESGGSLETQTVRTSISKDAESGQILEGPIISDNSGWQSFQPVSGAIDNDYTLEAFAIPLGKLIPKGMGRFGKSANFADEGVGGAVKESTTALKSFTKGNFRHNLGQLTGSIPGNSQAHHVFPQKYLNQFAEKGINIHDPKFGTWWETSSHLKNATGYNTAWGQFLRTNPTQAQILDKGRQLMQKYGIPVNY